MKRAETLGAWGERLAEKFLRKKGLRLVESNFSCRFGELDLILEDREHLVFAEVKLRKDESHGLAREFVTAAKQARLRTAAAVWLSTHPTEKQPRFDVVEIYAPCGRDTKKPVLIHLEDAFQ